MENGQKAGKSRGRKTSCNIQAKYDSSQIWGKGHRGGEIYMDWGGIQEVVLVGFGE